MQDQSAKRSLIIQHYTKPEFLRKDFPNKDNYKKYEGNFACCSDEITIFVTTNNKKIDDIFFEGFGCAIAIATTDLLLKHSIHQSFSKIRDLMQKYKAMIMDNSGELNDHELSIFKDFVKRQNRVKCAMMSCDILEQIIKTSN